ncbi:hypothetical protein ACQKE4_01550 [Halomonas sp. NPDC076908]|uniref:hypothetical protein n=1 Tax=Halomonas sp. NPDC076908 TaxID=3390567 RepID=UPI000EC0351C|nr:hypothetical protein [Halomonas sp. 54_146]HAA45975.1 hypothetical protein [Halomonas sp.]
MCWIFAFLSLTKSPTKKAKNGFSWTILCLTCPLLQFGFQGCAQPLVVDAKKLEQNLNSLKTMAYDRSKNNQFKADPLPMAILGRFKVVVNRVIHR